MPQERDLPTGTAEVTDSGDFNSSVEDISNLLGDDPETDLDTEDQDHHEAEPEDPDGDDGAEDVETVDDEDPDGSDQPEVKGGRFAPDSAKVTLDDGTVTTVAELKRNNLFQRDYTKKTTEHSEKVKAFEARSSEVDQYAQSLNQFRDYVSWYAETHMPKRPEPFKGNAMADPAGFIQWQQDEATWRSHQEAHQVFQQQRQAEDQRRASEAQGKAHERLQEQAEVLAEAFPVLKNPEKRKQFWERLEAGAAKYFGIKAAEVQSIGDARIVRALHAAVDRERLREKAPQVREEVQKRPQGTGKRLDPKVTGGREKQVRSERLRTRGSFQDGVAALMDIPDL